MDDLEIIIMADAMRVGRLDRQCELIRRVIPAPIRMAEKGGPAASLADEMALSSSLFSLVLPLGIFPGARSIFPLGGPIAVVGGRGEKEGRPGVNVGEGGLATHFAYGASQRWTGCFALDARWRERFVDVMSAPRRQNWLVHEALNLLLSEGMEMEARARTIDKCCT